MREMQRVALSNTSRLKVAQKITSGLTETLFRFINLHPRNPTWHLKIDPYKWRYWKPSFFDMFGFVLVLRWVMLEVPCSQGDAFLAAKRLV